MQALVQSNVHRKAVASSHTVSNTASKAVGLAAVRPAIQPGRSTIQTKLAVNTPGDKFEQEANAVAEKVVQLHPKDVLHTPMPAKTESVIQSQPAKVHNMLWRKCAHCEADEKKLQRKNNTPDKSSEMVNAPANMQRVETDLKHSKGQGKPLPASVNKFMGKAMGADFSKVRIHTGSKAIGMSKALNAHAFAHGADIYFNEGQFDPESERGRHLLAHELVHVVQQGYASPLEGGKEAGLVQKETIQRFELSDLNPFDVSIDDLVKRFVPELVEIKQAGGMLEWVEKKVSGAIEKIMNAAIGPVKNAMNVISNLSPTLAKIILWLKNAGVKISKNDCSSFTELGQMVEQLVDELAGPAIEKIKEVAGKVSDWCKDIWEKFGLPVWDFIKKFIGDQWEMLKKLGNWIWDKTEPIRDWAESVWVRFKNWLGIGEGPAGQNGILQWIEGKIMAAWNKIQEKIAPYKKQLMVIVGVLVMLSPAGPLIAAGALFGILFTAINWIRKNIHSPQDIVKLRVKFEKEILPSITQGVTKASEGLKAVFGKLTGLFGKVAGAFGNLTNLVAAGILSFIQSALQWVTDKFTDLVEWATNKLGELVTWLDGIFQKVRTFVAPIIRFLEKVSAVAESIMELPMLILGGLWNKVPSCIRVPVEDFLVNVILKKVPFFEDIVAIAGVWQKIKKGAMDILKTIFIHGDLKGGILKAFKLFLDVLNIPVQLVTGIFNKAVDAFDTIVSKPRVIFSNIVSAIKAGFNQFYKNFLKNTMDAVGNWIFSKVKGVKMPKEYTIQSVFGLALDILGITEDNIFDRIEKKTSKDFSKKLRSVYHTIKGAAVWVIDVLKDPKAAYEKAKQHLKNLKNKLFESIGAWIAENVIGKFIAEMTLMLASTPFGEAIEAIIDAYKMVKTALEYAEKILRVIDSVLDSILDLASGTITKAADTVEKGMVFGLEVAVAFIAKVISIGDLPQQVKKIVEEDIRPIINKGIDAVVDGVIAVVKVAKEFLGFDKKDKDQKEERTPEKQMRVDAGVLMLKQEEKKFLKDNKMTKTDADKIAAAVKSNHAVFSSFKAIDIGDKIRFVFTASPEETADEVAEAVEEGALDPKIQANTLILAKYVSDKPWVAKVEFVDKEKKMIKYAFVAQNLMHTTTFETFLKKFVEIWVADLREMYVGSTPGKRSDIGQKVIDRMRRQGKIEGSKPDEQVLFQRGWYHIEDCDMSHVIGAAKWWTELGGWKFGPRSEEARKFMEDDANYILEPLGPNRARGASEPRYKRV